MKPTTLLIAAAFLSLSADHATATPMFGWFRKSEPVTESVSSKPIPIRQTSTEETAFTGKTSTLDMEQSSKPASNPFHNTNMGVVVKSKNSDIRAPLSPEEALTKAKATLNEMKTLSKTYNAQKNQPLSNPMKPRDFIDKFDTQAASVVKYLDGMILGKGSPNEILNVKNQLKDLQWDFTVSTRPFRDVDDQEISLRTGRLSDELLKNPDGTTAEINRLTGELANIGILRTRISKVNQKSPKKAAYLKVLADWRTRQVEVDYNRLKKFEEKFIGDNKDDFDDISETLDTAKIQAGLYGSIRTGPNAGMRNEQAKQFLELKRRLDLPIEGGPKELKVGADIARRMDQLDRKANPQAQGLNKPHAIDD